MQGGIFAEGAEGEKRNPNLGLFHRKVYGNPRLGHAPEQIREPTGMGCGREVAVGESSERRLEQRVIGSKAIVMWYYETVANYSLATPSASDSHLYACANVIMVQELHCNGTRSD